MIHFGSVTEYVTAKINCPDGFRLLSMDIVAAKTRSFQLSDGSNDVVSLRSVELESTGRRSTHSPTTASTRPTPTNDLDKLEEFQIFSMELTAKPQMLNAMKICFSIRIIQDLIQQLYLLFGFIKSANGVI